MAARATGCGGSGGGGGGGGRERRLAASDHDAQDAGFFSDFRSYGSAPATVVFRRFFMQAKSDRTLPEPFVWAPV